MIDFIIVGVLVGSTLWVYLDLTKYKIGRVKNVSGLSFNWTAWGWIFALAFLWILFFPAYLYKRDDLIERAKNNPVQYKRRAFNSLAIIVGGVIILSFYNIITSIMTGHILPACDSPETRRLVSEIVNDMPTVKLAGARFVSLEDIFEVSSDQQTQVRACSATLVSTAGKNTLFYSVFFNDPGAGQFFVQANIVR